MCENVIDFVSMFVYLINESEKVGKQTVGQIRVLVKNIIKVLIYTTLICEIVHGLMRALQLHIIILKDGMINALTHTCMGV